MSLLQMLLSFIKPPKSEAELSFDWKYEIIPGVGKFFRPYVPIRLRTVEYGWKSFNFIADTGADKTMLPHYMLEILGVDRKKIKKSYARGIGDIRVTTWETTIPIRINYWKFTVPVSFTLENDTPFLLGRADTLDSKFSWIFDHKKKKIIFRR